MHSNVEAGVELKVNSLYLLDWDIWKAFDGRTDTAFSTQYDSPVTSITISLPSPQICHPIRIHPHANCLHRSFGAPKPEGMGKNGTGRHSITKASLHLGGQAYRITGTPLNGENCLSVAGFDLLQFSDVETA